MTTHTPLRYRIAGIIAGPASRLAQRIDSATMRRSRRLNRLAMRTVLRVLDAPSGYYIDGDW